MKEIYGSGRRAYPADVTVRDKNLIVVKSPVGDNQTLEFSLDDNEVEKFWALIESARKRAFQDAISQNL